MRYLPILALLLGCVTPLQAQGLLLPEIKENTPPLAMIHHEVSIAIQDQAADTQVQQTFRNHTNRNLQATYVFPVPRGASVRGFSMMVNGTKVDGKLVDGTEARRLCAECARRSQDPALVDYLGNELLTMNIVSIQPGKDLNVTVNYSALATQDHGLIEYVYPLKTDGKSTSTLQKFAIKATIKSQHAVQNVYSPTHALSLTRVNDKEVRVEFEKDQALLDKDFQLYYTLSNKDVGLTSMIHRPADKEDGYFMFLIAPRLEAPKQVIPRDLLFVVDTSGSMSGAKLDQARKALHFCLDNMNKEDRFGLVNFSTSVTRYQNELIEATPDELGLAHKWIDKLASSGGTAIDAALSEALSMRTRDASRTFTIIFFTDGLPTVGERNPATIVRNVENRNSANTRIFTFGVGNDVNATMLDKLAEKTR
ncbi:MAG: VIT domain-containing protein, partial [Gemmataceae bacterium]